MKRFMYLSIGVLCLMLAVVAGYHLGSQTAQAQAANDVTGSHWNGEHTWTVMLANGDLYKNSRHPFLCIFEEPATYLGNFWNGAPVPTSSESWGSIKNKSK